MADPAEPALAQFGPLLDRMEELLGEAETLPGPQRALVFELLDGVDAVHRLAVTRLADRLAGALAGLRRDDPAIDWLFQAYGVDVTAAAAVAALDPVRPYLHQHGGEVEVLGVRDGVVRLRLTGACSGCTGAADTLRLGIEAALRENLVGFVALDVVADHHPAHPPPGPVLLEITPRPR